MALKHALVVDDSRLARYTLSKLLETYKLSVDTAESAEDALVYLASNKPPHVIFMDHMMPGMDGLQAVQVIKKDSRTAMIPIVMYTSKEGELYMGQARALGAIGVLPKPIKPVELEKIIYSLNLLSAQAELVPPEANVTPATPPPTRIFKASPAVPHFAIEEIAHDAAMTIDQDTMALLRRLLDDHRTKLNQDIAAGSEDIAERVVHKLEQKKSAMPRWLALLSQNWRRFKLPALFAGIALVIASVIWFVLRDETVAESPVAAVTAPAEEAASSSDRSADVARQSALVSEDNAKLLETLETRNKVAEQNAKLLETIENLKIQIADQRLKLTEVLGWAINLNNSHSFDHMALGDERLPLLNELILRLSAVDFRGTLRIKVHVGEFCLVRNEMGEYKIPADDAPIENCQTLGLNLEQSVAHGARQSLGFARFLANAPYHGGKINVEVVSHGREKPLYKYPIITSLRTAGEWNKMAKLNNRVEIAIIPSTQ